MSLLKLEDYYPNYHEVFGGDDIKKLNVYTQGGDKVGSIKDVLVDDKNGNFRYLVVDTGALFFGKKILLPIGLAHIDYNTERVSVDGLTKKQVESLPEYDDKYVINKDYEDRVRSTYSTASAAGAVSRPEAIAPQMGSETYAHDSYHYDQYPSLYNLNEQNSQKLKLYEERLIAEKHRQKVGEVVVGKHIETETAHASVPVEKERVIIERSHPTESTSVGLDETSFREGEVARIEVFEEVPDIRKEAFVREELTVKKVVDRDVVEAEETIRREELDVNSDGTTIVNPSDQYSRKNV